MRDKTLIIHCNSMFTTLNIRHRVNCTAAVISVVDGVGRLSGYVRLQLAVGVTFEHAALVSP